MVVIIDIVRDVEAILDSNHVHNSSDAIMFVFPPTIDSRVERLFVAMSSEFENIMRDSWRSTNLFGETVRAIVFPR